MNRGWDNLERLIDDTGFSKLKRELRQFARPSIRVETTFVENEDVIPIGQSKIGGRPDLPEHTVWPTFDFRDKVWSIPFVAQFNLEEVKSHDVEDLLPHTGMLYFFLELDPLWEGRVVYYDGDLSELGRRAFPDDILLSPTDVWAGNRYDPCSLEFIPEVNFDDYAVCRAKWDYPEGLVRRHLIELVGAANYRSPRPTFPFAINRLLGNSSAFSEDMQLESQAMTVTGRPSYKLSPEERVEAEKHKADWQLLFQVDSDDNAAMMWSDAGTVYFYIRRQDLKACNFDDVYITMECG